MNFFEAIWAWILSLFGADEISIKIGRDDSVFMPLFYRDTAGSIASTWDYLSKSATEQAHCRKRILELKVGDEIPAICFLLSPSAEGGNLFTPWPTVNEANLDRAATVLKQTVKAGIACFACLYTDDKNPRWFEIGGHQEVWKTVYAKIGKYLTGAVLSIETNEYARDRTQIETCIQIMKDCMPDFNWYGVHLNWLAKSGVSNYRWGVGDSTPHNADFLLVENSWQPQAGDAVGVPKVREEYVAITAYCGRLPLVFNEYNFNPAGKTPEQRAYLRSQHPFGVG